MDFDSFFKSLFRFVLKVFGLVLVLCVLNVVLVSLNSCGTSGALDVDWSTTVEEVYYE